MLSHVFGKPVFLRLFFCFALAQFAQVVQRERISQVRCSSAAETLVVCSGLLPFPCGPISGASLLLHSQIADAMRKCCSG